MHEPFLEELVAMVYERGVPFSMDPTTVLHSVERYWRQRHDMASTTRMPGIPNGSPIVGKLLSSEVNIQALHRLGVEVTKLPKKEQRGYRFALNHNADKRRIGSNPRAGKNLITSGEYDELEPTPSTRPLTEAQWAARLAELDAPNEDPSTNVVPMYKLKPF